MPWLETDVRDQRIQFVVTVRRGEVTVTDACRALGISRKTGTSGWLARPRPARCGARATKVVGRTTVRGGRRRR